MKKEESKARVANAVRAMKAIGISEDTVKLVLKELLKLFKSNWALIEKENYRALTDAIYETDELEAEEKAQATGEPERPLKRLRGRHQDGQTSSLNESNVSVPKTPLASHKEPDTVSKSHVQKRNNPEGIEESPQQNAGKTMTKPQAVTCQSPGSNKRKQPLSSKSLVPHDHGRGYPSRSSINTSQQSTRLIKEPRSPTHPMKLRNRCKGDDSIQNRSKEKRLIPESSSHVVHPLKDPKLESDILSSPRKNKVKSPAFNNPKDKPMTVDMSYPGIPDVIINTENGGHSLSRNGLLYSPEPAALQSVYENGTTDGTATLYESRNSGELDITSGLCTSSSLEIASSASGDVKISLSYNLAPGRPDFHTSNLEAVLRSVEDKYHKSTKIVEPKISMINLIKDICQCFLKLGTNLNSQSPIMESTPTKDSMRKSSVPDDSDARCLRCGAKVPDSNSTAPHRNGINGRPKPGKLDGRDKTVITRENQDNCAGEMNSLSLGTVQQPQPEITKLLHDVVDIAKGHENVVITLVNEVNDESPPSFNYIPQNAVFQNAYMNFSLARSGDDDCCATCSGDCLLSSFPCACSYETGGEFAYTADGLVKEEFLKECISMNRNPKNHCQFFCQECPLERSKCEDIIEPCKGHLVRKFIKECWRKCGCNKHCGNRVVQRGITRKLQVFMTHGKGWGLRTLEDLPKGVFVCEYVGEVLTNAELFERVLRKPKGEKHSYPVLLDADWCAEGVLKDEEALCLDATYYGNVARFINHKCYDSNLVEIPVEVDTPDHHYYHLAFFTTRKVKAMEELTWDYGIDFDDHEHPIKAFHCQCGSKFCRNIKRSRSRARR